MTSHPQISAGARLYSELNFSFHSVYDLVLTSEQARNCRPQTDPLHSDGSVYSPYSRVSQLFLPYGIYIMNWDELHGKYENFNECTVHYLSLTHDPVTELECAMALTKRIAALE